MSRQTNESETKRDKQPYTTPKLQVFGQITEMTEANQNGGLPGLAWV